MRITDIDLEIEDLEWYGVDDKGKIAQFFSGGSKAVPEFICESRENLNIVCEFFENFTVSVSKTILWNEHFNNVKKEFIQECKMVSQRGIYCFDMLDNSETLNEYIFICKPSCALFLHELPVSIQNILSHYKLENVNFENDKIVIPLK